MENLGIDPDLLPVTEENDSQEVEAVPSSGKKKPPGDRSSIVSSSSSLKSIPDMETDLKGAKKEKKKSLFMLSHPNPHEVFCEYCGGSGHLETDCPHDNRNSEDDDESEQTEE